jgi:DNA relaxase NicK
LSELDGENGLLENVGFDVKWRQGKGLHGYSESASILLWKDNDYMTVGNLAYSEDGRNKGGMFELTGIGCKVLQVEYPMLWSELHALLTEYAWRISRADVALDMSGEYCTAMGYTVPKLMREAYLNGLFTSEKLKNPNFEPEMDGRGNWTPLSAGVLTPDTYNPLEHCPKGLTFYVGNRAGSDDFFRVYEKGKEILGKQAEPESIDRAWVRIEHEMSRKGSGRTIPLAVMLEPDTYFCAARPKVREIMDDMRNRCGLNETQQWQKEKFEKEKSLMLSRKVHWARHTYGRTIHTMRDLGWDDGKIVNALMREAGLKEFIPDLLDHAPDEGETIDYLLDEDES